MFSVVMPYYRRASQFFVTMQSFAALYRPSDYEIILVVDSKNTDADRQELREVIAEFTGINFTVIQEENSGHNPAPMFNAGVRVAKGGHIVITNPECSHETDVLKGLKEELEKDRGAYVVCACKSIKNGKFHRWFQHSKEWNRLFHFCSAMHRDTFDSLGGFDERFGGGIGYDDDDFRDRILAAGIRVVVCDDLVVCHQEHNKNRPSNYKKLHERNRHLWLNGREHLLRRAIGMVWPNGQVRLRS